MQNSSEEGAERPNRHSLHSIEELDPNEVASVASSGSDTPGDSPLRRINSHVFIDDIGRAELHRIATALSHRRFSVRSVDQPTAADYKEIWLGDDALKPENPEFDLGKWLRTFVQRMSTEGISPARTGVTYRNLTVSGTCDSLLHQQTVASYFLAPFRPGEFLSLNKKPKKILNSFDGLLESGELLVVLGRPGSGCSTFLKTICGELHGLQMDKDSSIHYRGVSQKQMVKEFKGEVVYNQEVDHHFPHLTVGQTLEFAAAARMPSNRIEGVSRETAVKHVAKIVMAVCGLSHTYNTKVGNDFVRGVSGGERKRVSIAEMMVTSAPLLAWDNSTRGLDSATALKFVQTLRLSSDITAKANAVAIYQASQAIYDLFDKAVVLYEGRTIYFGPAQDAKAFFEKQGWHCPQRQTTGDFLTSLTNPQERIPREGMENKVPRTSEDFERYWRESPEYKALLESIDQFEKAYPQERDSEALAQLREHKEQRQAKHVRPKSPYIISNLMQIKLNTKRAYQRLWGDKQATLTQAVVHLIMALIIGSVFFGTPDATVSFFARGSVLFMAVLLNALSAIVEISSLYNQRPIVEKQASYAFYHPATEALAGIVADIPVKFIIAVFYNIVLYFMAELRREAGPFFLYFLVSYIATFVMSGIFRTMAAVTKTVSQAMTLAGIVVLALVIYTGFVIATPQMHPWFGWIRWINPLYYTFEILIANEFHGRQFPCSSIIPAYSPPVGTSWICNAIGAVAGEQTVSGDAFIEENYRYYYSHVWRNFGILMGFLVFFMAIYCIATELNSSASATADVLVFQRGKVPPHLNPKTGATDKDVTAGKAERIDGDGAASIIETLEPQKDIFTWRNVSYDVDVKGGTRRLLNDVVGWVKPGTLTALMGVSGAGKTTLLDVLAQRTSMGVVHGDMFVNGKPLDASFQRKTGYVQQQDLHLETATVRESLRFSAMLRQPNNVSKAEKYKYVEEVIDMLNMSDFADAVVGIPGEGLNVEQRKLLTIGVELAAKPKLLLFLDEPTSGLDSQSSWAICVLLRKLANAGQAILCTVHQPSAILFQQFDRLLFLAQGGKTVYFGDIGENSRTLLDYFESNGARKCSDTENPAEYMLEVVNRGMNEKGLEWDKVWNSSPERQAVDVEIDRIHEERKNVPISEEDGHRGQSEFAVPFIDQLWAVTQRVFQQYWRMPNYIFAKFLLGLCAGLFIGFSFFQPKGTLAGMQNVIFAVFQVITIFSIVVQQIQPLFVTQRSLYEVRERPSKAYSWKAFIMANVIVEIPYQIITGIIIFGCFYYPVAGIQSSERQGLVLLFCIQLFVYASSFAQMTIAAVHDAQTAGGYVVLLVMMSLVFCGVLQTPDALPGFWIFMYRVSPFTYWTSGMVSTQLHERLVNCSPSETSIFNPPQGMTCGDYMAPYLQKAPGQLQNPNDTASCRYCSLTVADQYLAGSKIYWTDRWRNFGLVWAYVVFNIFIAVVTYYLFRVKKWGLGSFKRTKKPNKQGEEKKDKKDKKSEEESG